MNKSFAIPQQVIDCINFFDYADRGMAFSAIFDYANKGIEPSASISAAARGAFEFARRIIDPILARRRKATERRAARKEAARQAAEAGRKESEKESKKAMADDKRAAIEEHTHIMRKVVDLAYRTCSTNARREDKIRSELERRFPGQYRDIIYDSRANVILVPAV